MKVLRVVLAAFFAAVLAGCSSDRSAEDVKRFFEKGKFGMSPDYAIVKWGNMNDHIVTVHGLMDDLKACMMLAKALNDDACSETGGNSCLNPFSCRPINH